LAESAELRAAVIESVRESPRVGGTGSRLLSGHCAIWDDLEHDFAKFASTESALYFGSGYAANIGLLTSVLERDDVVFSDELNHASIIDGVRLSGAEKEIYPHRDLNALESFLRAHSAGRARKFIVTETVFSMDGDVVALTDLMALAERYGAGLILDDAHATAVHGPAGRGIAVDAGVTEQIVAVLHTCSKALASAGAFVCGSALLKEHLINRARTFIFSTAMPPYMAGQIRAALLLVGKMDRQRATLKANACKFSSALRAQGWDTANSSTQIVPVVVGGNEEALQAAEFLQREGFAVRAIRPPTVRVGSARLRFSLTCALQNSELSRLENAMSILRSRQPVHSFAVQA
jgi:8-amino-7-oxononanoate synthase